MCLIPLITYLQIGPRCHDTVGGHVAPLSNEYKKHQDAPVNMGHYIPALSFSKPI